MRELPTQDPELNHPMISTTYEAQLSARYDVQIVDEIAHNWRYAELSDYPGEQIAYVRLNEGAGSKPVLFIPGFTEGIISKAPFAADLAQRGHDVILPDQNRKKILKDAMDGEKHATRSQALNYLSVIEAEGLLDVNIVTHSYGSLIFDEMVRIAEESGKQYFKDSKVIMLAPSGFSEEKHYKLGKRLLASMKSEGKKNPKDFESNPEMLRAGIKNFTANIPRTLREIDDLTKKQVDYKRLLDGQIGSLIILSYAGDVLYSDDIVGDEVEKAVASGVTWATPVSQKVRYNSQTAKPHATHNDEQFNPYRVAASVDELLR